MNIIFFGSSSYCIPILESLSKNFSLIYLITKTNSVPLKFAQKNHIPASTPQNNTNLQTLHEKLSTLKPDLAIVADFGMIIPPEIFHIPQYKTLNIHFSKLPDLRGASPVQFTIFRGDRSAWITIIIMDQGLDTGDIIFQKEVKIAGNEISEGLYKKLFNIVSVDLPAVINNYVQKKIHPIKQNHQQATYTKIFERNDGYIPYALLSLALRGGNASPDQFNTWPLYKYLSSQLAISNYSSAPTRFAARQVGGKLPVIIERASRALSTYPGIWTNIKIKGQEKRLKILKNHLENNKLVIDMVQLEGKNPVSWKQFQEGYPQIIN